MSEPIFVINKLVIDSGDMSGDLQGLIVDLAEATGYAVHSKFDGAPDGILSVLGSNTDELSDFVEIDTYIITEAGIRLLNVEKTHYRYVTVAFEFSSGTGTLNSRVSAKRA